MATRILFVDQSALIQKMAAQAFAQQKIEVIKVASGDLATWLINQINPDLVIADVSVPDKSGYELCQYIKGDARLAHIPVVLLYWPDQTYDYSKANGARADAYLTKPFESQTLVETAQRLLQNGGDERSASAPPLPDLESIPIVSDEPLDISDLFEAASFKPYSRATASEAEFPFLLEDPPAPSGNATEHAADEKIPLVMTAPDEQALIVRANGQRLIAQQRSGSGKKWAAVALAAMIILAFALTPGLWKSTRVHETQPDLSPTVSNPESVPQQKTDPAAIKESSQPVSSTFVGDRRNNNPAAPVFKAQNNSTVNRSEDRQAKNTYTADRAESKPPQPTPPALTQAAAPPEKSSRIEQSPPRTISGDAASPAIPNDVKPGSASQQPSQPENGFKQIGSEVKGAVVWSGKKAGRGLKAIGRGLKKAFKHDSQLD